MKTEKTSANREFHTLTVGERLNAIGQWCGLSPEAIEVFENLTTLSRERLEEIGENPVSNFELPLRIADHFRINGKRYYVPYVVEEASVVAGACYGAKVCGNIEARVEADKSYAKSQIQLIKVKDLTRAKKAVLNSKDKLLSLANSAHKHSKAFGIEVKASRLTRGNCLTVNLLIDPGDAMGAAVASEMAEAVAPELAVLTGSTYNARIISNYSGRLTKATAKIPVRKLKTTAKLGDKRSWSGEEVCERILWLYEWAEADEERAVTYNKGIMNGVDAVALATCQDWRAIEAANTLYSHRSGRCRPLSKWYQQGDCLVGEIELLIPCGIVGGEIKKYPKAEKLIKEVLKLKSADELAEIMAAAGLANNFAAQRMLATFGISLGHKPHRKLT